ncbi:MAG: tRNA adenosine(34) deaminase TadA [Synergistaceae bacterium]
MDDVYFMSEALKEAEKAAECGDVPVGAVVVRGEEIIGRGYNRRSAEGSPFSHAEMVAMESAAKSIGSWRFDGCSLYVTLEPCVMCSGAIVQCRMGRVVFGAYDPKAGGSGSLYDILRDPRMYHRCVVDAGVLKHECADILFRFFEKRRKKCRHSSV